MLLRRVGFVPSEAGLHWLILQRELNLARIAESARPHHRFFSDGVSHNPLLKRRRLPINA